MTARHTSDLDCCAHCGRLLTDYEEVLCGPCTQKALDTWEEPTDHEKLRAWAITERMFAGDWAALLFPLLCLVIAGTCLWGGNAHAQDSRIVTRTINDRPYTWTLPEAGCQFVRGWDLGECPTCKERYAIPPAK